MENSCYTPKNCSFWFCQTKGKCLLDKNSKTPQRFKKVKNIKKVIKQKVTKQTSITLYELRKKWKQHPKRVVSLIFNGHDAACACCYTLNDLTFDHIIPLDKGGKNTLKNGQILCTFCNGLKGNSIISIKKLQIRYNKIVNLKNNILWEK